MSEIKKYSGNSNIGGICEVRFLKRCNFEKYQLLIERYRGKNGIIKISAKEELLSVFEKIYHTRYLGFHEQQNTRSTHGLSFPQTLTFSVPKDRPEVLARITQLQDEPITVIFRNNNDDWKLIGTEEDWAMMQIAQQTGTDTADPNKYIFEVVCNSRYLSPFLEYEVREEEPPPVDEPADCFDSGSGYSHKTVEPREGRKSYFSQRFLRAGTYKVTAQIDLPTQVIIRDLNTSTIIDIRNIPSGTSTYT
ncbi:hypothetical protein, partial [Bernardetia sp.]|uniref:hypothetical protein n=1 Tax=Bernardetia sp. TaxID=1937974 RepID=UPI0025BD89C3